MSAPDDHRAAPPVGEQIHMPAPSLLPILNAVGLSTAIIGITISIIPCVLVYLLLQRYYVSGLLTGAVK